MGSTGGSGEIRTHGRDKPSPVFKTGALNRSATLPVLSSEILGQDGRGTIGAMLADTPTFNAAGLQRLVVKDGVRLGIRPAPQLPWALGCVWATLPAHTMNGPQVNQALKSALAGATCWLDTDHFERRRWLVDAGWLARNGFGRSYDLTPANCLREAMQPVAAAWGAPDISGWVALARHRHQEKRAARRQVWQQQA